MKIAVTYENGEIFQHFGRSEKFKIYDVEDGKVVSSKVIGTDGRGHSALALVLSENSIDTLICGGIGMGAQNALAEIGVNLIAGASGDADSAVSEYLKGNLVNQGSSCSNHHEGEGCTGGHCCH